MKKNKIFFIIVIAVAFSIITISCTERDSLRDGSESSNAISQSTNSQLSTQQSESKDSVNSNTSGSNNLENKLNPEINVLYDYAKNINDKKYDLALKDLGQIISIGISTDDESFKNIKEMKIITLKDKTGINENGRWYVNPRNVGNIEDSRVYYAEIEYQLSGTAFSYLIDGINYFKIVFVKENKDSPWKIGEMSSAEKDWGKD